MESSRYWQGYRELDKRSSGLQSAEDFFHSPQEEDRTEQDIFVHGGRCMSLEVYLTVPTFIRRGLRIAE